MSAVSTEVKRIDQNAFDDNNDEVILENEKEQLDPASHSDDESVYPMKTLKVDKGFYTAFELKRKLDRKPSLIILDSDFQRESVWKLQQKRELIESVLMGLPLPIFYFNEDKLGRLIVIDGRQRLTALFEFMDGKKGFTLDGLKILDEFNKKKFKDLDPVLQSKIEDYQIMAYIIQPPTPDKVKFDIFDRVNRAGTPLNKQEIRNALYQGNATILLNALSKTECFSQATEGVFGKDVRMKDRYLLLRFIAFYLYFNKMLYVIKDHKNTLYQYTGDIDDFLGVTMDYINNTSDDEVKEIESMTLSALQQSIFYLETNAFRLTEIDDKGNLKRFPININIFETIMYGMTLLPFKENKIRMMVRDAIVSMKTNGTFRDSLYNNRDSETNVSARYYMIKKIVGDIDDKKD